MADRCFIGVDLGAESGRVIAGRFDGRRLQLAERHRFANEPLRTGGALHWNLDHLWSEIGHGLAAAATGESEIVSVGVDSWGVDYVLLSPQGERVGLSYHYRDERTKGFLAKALQQVPADVIYAATGIQFLELNTLYQLMSATERAPRELATARTLLLIADYFHWRFSGVTASEATLASTTQCWDPTSGTWASQLLDSLAIPRHLFAGVVRPGTVLGPLIPDVAALAGSLRKTSVVVPASHDTAAAVVAVPAGHTSRWAYISSGTWSLVGLEIPNPILTAEACALNLTNEHGLDGTTRLLRNVMGLWLLQRCRASLQRAGTDLDYAEWMSAAARAMPWRSLIDPDDPVFLNPADMPAAIEGYCRRTRQTSPGTPGELARCILESLALKYDRVLTGLCGVARVDVEVVHIVGGGSRSELLNQLTADVCGIPVIAGPVEATALGNILVQARAAGEVDSLAEMRDIVRASTELREYWPRDQDPLPARRAFFAELCENRIPARSGAGRRPPPAREEAGFHG